MRIITFRFLGETTERTAIVDGRTKTEADANAIRIFAEAEADRSASYEIGRTARAGERRSLPNILDAIRNV